MNGNRSYAQGNAMVVPCSVLMGLAAVALATRTVAAMSGMFVAAFVAAAAMTLRPPRGTAVSPSLRQIMVPAAILTLAGLLRAVFSEAPMVSIFGARGQHTGALLWVLILALLWATTTRGRRGDIGYVAPAVSLVGAVVAFGAVAERFGLLRFTGTSDAASGFMDNTLSLAQVLVLGLGCSLFVLIRGRDWQRVPALAAVLLIAVGLYVSDARTAYLAVVFSGALLFGLKAAADKIGITSRWLATGASLVLGGALAASVLLGYLGVGNPLAARLNGPLNGRVVVWTAVVERAEMSPLLGQGPEQFNGLSRWDALPGDGVDYATTDDPHSAVLYWLLALGIPGVAVLTWLTWVVAERVGTALIASKWDNGLLLLVAGLSSFGLTVLTAWTSPYAAVLATTVLGAVIVQLEPSPRPPSEESPAQWQTYAQLALVLTVTATTVVLGFNTLRAEMTAAGVTGGSPLQTQDLVAMTSTTGDVLYAIQASEAARSRISSEADRDFAAALLKSVAPVLEPHARRSARAALELVVLRYTAAVLDAGATWADVKRDLSQARANHPGSGMWDYMGTVFAESLGTKEEVSGFASAALDYPLSAQLVSWCEDRSGIEAP